MTREPVTQERLEAWIARNAFNHWLGLGVRDFGEGRIALTVPWRAEFASNPEIGYAHGGVLAAIVAMAGSLALGTQIGRLCPNIDLRVDYHRPAMPGALIAHGRIIRAGRTIATAEAEVVDRTGNLLASGRGTYITAKAD